MTARKPIAALAVLFLFAHLLSLPPALEDIDSINFALGVRDFDVARHQPHPPGSPVFIGLAKLSTAVLHALGVPAPAPRALALLSAVSGALMIPLVFTLYRRFESDHRLAWWSMAVAVCSPLFWFTALRPLSDMTGLACAVAAQALLLAVFAPRVSSAIAPSDPSQGESRTASNEQRTSGRAKHLIAGAAMCGLAAGVRAQTVMLTAPLLVAALVWPGTRLTVWHRALALVAAAAGVLLWGVPLLVASGGASGYLAALGAQAGEDFSGVVMLWTTRSPRVALEAVLYSFVWPWGTFGLGLAILVVAALGLLRAAWRIPGTAMILGIAFGPYAAFHLLFHETITVRYALPLVVPMAFLAVYAASAFGQAGLAVTSAVTVCAMLAIAVPAARAYGHDRSPVFRLFHQWTVKGQPVDNDGTVHAEIIGMHAGMRRVSEWIREEGFRDLDPLTGRHGQEWLALVQRWRNDPDAIIRFVANPRRTDLALFDPHARQLVSSSRWTFQEMPFVAGTRPGAADFYTMRPPGWMLDRGWALTAEVGGVTAREGLGPHVQASVAWVRARPEQALLVIGGRNLGAPGDPAARVTVAGPTGTVEMFDVPPGFFFRPLTLSAGTLAGAGYVSLRVSAVAADTPGHPVRVSLEQFDVQSDTRVMVAFVEGWGEPEYNPGTGRAWRWMSERATLWVRPVARDLTLALHGESPLRYFDRAPAVRVSVGGQEVGRFSPSADFDQTVTLPAALLASADGHVLLESDLWFSPAERSGEDDRRQLALRIYGVDVR